MDLGGLNPGSTGHWPVPSGDSPGGTGRTPKGDRARVLHVCASFLPVGESPTGAGGSPVPPTSNAPR
jgi:hypothetical protein